MIEQDKSLRTQVFSTGNLIDDFVLDTPTLESPEVFRKWAAIALISGTCQRRLWCNVGKGPLFPNQYIMLVSPPGIGKSVVLNIVESLWKQTQGLYIGDSKTTIQGLLDFIADSPSPVNMNNLPVNTHPMTCAPREYGTFMTAYDLTVLNILNDFWDCPAAFTERTRGGGLSSIEYPVLNLISGTQPSYLNNVLPDEAWSLGFCSRLILVFAYEAKRMRTRERLNAKPFDESKYLPFLQNLQKAQGEMKFTPDAIDFFDEWIIDNGMKPVPMHPKLESYVARRQVHWLKVSMCRALAEGSLLITKDHMEKAKVDLLEMESLMPEIFKDIDKDSDKVILDEVKLFLIRLGSSGKPFPERKLVQFLSTKIAPQRIHYMLDLLQHSGFVEETDNPAGLTQRGNIGYRYFKAGPDLTKTF